MRNTPSINIEVWTERFLGSEERVMSLTTMLETIDTGIWKPEKWGHFEPIRSPYTSESQRSIIAAISDKRNGTVSNHILFTRKKPSLLVDVAAWRARRVASLNRLWMKLEAKPFDTLDGADRIVKIATALVDWCDGAYLTASHSAQSHDRMAQRTPQERLERMDWLTFFGPPYIELFGGVDRILNAPCYSAKKYGNGVLLLAAERPDSTEITNSPDQLLALEQYLGPDAFAGNGYPDVPCVTPKFNLGETLFDGGQDKL
jgi:hypothetical protein